MKSEEDFAQMILAFVKDKRLVLEGLTDSLTKTDTNLRGLEKFIESIGKADMGNEANIRNKFRTLMKVQRDQNNMLKQLLLINLIYASAGNFTADSAQMANKLGLGEEALKAMFESKLKGN